MYTHNLNPIAISIGPLNIYWYSIVYIIGFLILYWFLNKKKEETGLDRKKLDEFIFWFMIGVVGGARLFEILIWEPRYYLSNPLKIFYVWEGGMALHGGIIGAILITYWFAKKHSINYWKLTDTIILPTAFILGFGRIANFVNGELWGTITNLPWCVEFTRVIGCRHPVQLYGAIGRFLVFGIILYIYKNKKYKEGYLFWMFLLLMGIGRFFADFLREDIKYLGLSTGQYASLIMAIIAGYWLWKNYKGTTHPQNQ